MARMFGAGQQQLYKGFGSQLDITPRLNSATAMPVIKPVMDNAGLSLAASLNKLNPILEMAAKDYRQTQIARVDDELINAEQEFDKWKTEYNQTHQGKFAGAAAQDYSKKAAELADKAMQNLGNAGGSHQIFEGLLKDKMKEREIRAFKEGAGYQSNEDKRWKDNQWQIQLAMFDRFVEDNAGNTDAITERAADLMASWQAKNPGLDPDLMRLKMQEQITGKVLESHLIREDFKGARAALSQNYFRDPRLYRGGQICEDLNNPLNLKKVGASGNGRESFEFFQTPEDGYRGAWRNLLAYRERGITSVQDIISTWAPPTENKTAAYIAEVCKMTGLSPKSEIDASDKRQAAALLNAMARQEGRLGTRYTPDKIEGMLSENGGIARRADLKGIVMPALSGLDYERAMKKIDGAELAAYNRRLAEERQLYGGMVKDYIEAGFDGKAAKMTLPKEKILELFGSETLQKVESAGLFADTVNGIHGLKEDQIISLIKGAEPKANDPNYTIKAKTYEMLEKYGTEILKRRKKDALGYINETDETARDALARMLTAPAMEERAAAWAVLKGRHELKKEQTGIITDETLGKTLAQALAKELENDSDPAGRLASYGQIFGKDFTKARREIMKNGSTILSIAGNGMDAEAGRLLLEAKREPKFMENAKAGTGVDKKEMELLARGELENALDCLYQAGQHELATELVNATVMLGYQNMLRFGDKSGAGIEKAAKEVLKNRVSYGSNKNGRGFIIPNEVNSQYEDLIEYGAKSFIKDVSAETAGGLYYEVPKGILEDDYKEQVARIIRENAIWVNDGEGAGLVLMLGTNAVLNKDMQPVRAAWQGLFDYAKGKKDAILKGMNYQNVKTDQ